MRVTPDCDSINSICINAYPGIQSGPAIAFGGGNYFTIWRDSRDGPGNYIVYGARITTAGVVLDPAGIPLSPYSVALSPTIEFDGSRFLVVWDHSNVRVLGSNLDIGHFLYTSFWIGTADFLRASMSNVDRLTENSKNGVARLVSRKKNNEISRLFVYL